MTSPIRSLALASALLAVLAACSKPEQPQMPPPEVVMILLPLKEWMPKRPSEPGALPL